VLLPQLGESVPTCYIPSVQHQDQQQPQLQLLQPQPATAQPSGLQQQPGQQLCAELQLRVQHDTAQMYQQSNKLPQGSLLREVLQASLIQPKQQRQRLMSQVQGVVSGMFYRMMSVVRLGRGHLVSHLCMTNLHTGQLMTESRIDHFKVGV
jgi:hypothetical protein